jgi:uncharacterized membrane protein|tara:strand:+ start:267 stop:803 length:537 start_codon:yes stop_codon:yes gene_type:complete
MAIQVKDQQKHPLKSKLTLGQRAADKLTYYAGTWSFIITLFVILALWVGFNLYALAVLRWDPYPFILLNLLLSCLAAVQAPVILMSQNRQTEKDRKRFEYDYAVNRKAEHEITDMQKDLEDIKVLIRTVKKDYNLNIKTDKGVESVKRHMTDVKKHMEETVKHIETLKKDVSHIKKKV